jgi:hypothetical protein
MVQKKVNKKNPKRESEKILTSMNIDKNLPNMEGLLSFEGKKQKI